MPKNVLTEPLKVPNVPPRPSTIASVPSAFSPPAGPPNLRTVTASPSDPSLWKPFFNEHGLASPNFVELLSAVFKHLDPNNTGVLTPEALSKFYSAMGEANLCKS